MKRLLVSILAILYLTTASGATVQLHFCMGRLAGITLFNYNDDSCGHCGMKKKAANDCCKSELKVVKVATAHIFTGSISYEGAVNPATPPCPISYSSYNTYPARNTEFFTPGYSPPHWLRSCPLYIAIRNLRV